MSHHEQLLNEQFPRSNAYHPDWVLASASGGANSLWLTEWLTSALDLRPGMKVLDLGCGRVASSVFLAREYNVSVWAVDLWFDATENQRRISDANLTDHVFPLRCDARALPFAAEFFDAVISIDAFPYFGTDDHYLNYLARFVKPEGIIGIALAGFVDELTDVVPEHLASWLKAEPALRSMHSSQWWSRHWASTGLVNIDLADSMRDGWRHWLKWHQIIAPDNHTEIDAIEKDQGGCLGYNRIVARRRLDACVNEPIASIPSSYRPMPLLRDA